MNDKISDNRAQRAIPAMTGAVNLLNKLLGSGDSKASHKARLRTVLAYITDMQQRESEPAAAQEAVAIDADVLHAMNGKLCDFAIRWKLDGDYLRCTGCKRPQLTNYAGEAFVHAGGCKQAATSEVHPWLALRRIMRPMFAPVAAAPVAQSSTKPTGSDSCPVTGLPFYDNMDHPERGMIAMYGGPFNVYSIPELDADGELRRERFDLDRDDWVEGGEPLGYFYREQQPEAVSTPAAPGIGLEQFRALACFGEEFAFSAERQPQSRVVYSQAKRLLTLIDASSKGDVHADDLAVDAFAAEMKSKLAAARAKGRGGWDGDEPGMQQRLSDMLRDHVEKGDPRDVANFCMFLHQRGEAISPKGGEVQDDRFPNGLADAIAYADDMENAAADLYQQVIGYETDGSDTGTDMLHTVLRELQASPKGGSTDATILDWLDQQMADGCAPAIVNDDDGRWAYCDSGTSPVPEEGGHKETVAITAFAEPEAWRPSIREAIQYAMQPTSHGAGVSDHG